MEFENLVTENELSLAIHLETGRSIEESTQKARYLLDFFGYSSSVVDNMLSIHDRDLFYTMEDHGILVSKMEMMENVVYIKNKNGKRDSWKNWRLGYWYMNYPRISEILENHSIGKSRKDELSPVEVYSNLSDSVWVRQEPE